MDDRLRLGEFDSLSDSRMMHQLRLVLLDIAAPGLLVDAILHGPICPST
jgi:hypothetical protein